MKNEFQKNYNISQGVRKSWEDPVVREKRCQRNAVSAHRNDVFVGDYSSLYQAFKALSLPEKKHISFRIKLKQVGVLPFYHEGDVYKFEVIPQFETKSS